MVTRTRINVPLYVHFLSSPYKKGRYFIGLGNESGLFLISAFLHVLNVVCFLLGNSPVPEFYMPTFRNTLPMKMEQSVPKRRHIKFRHRGITQKKAYNRADCVWCGFKMNFNI